MTRSFSGSPFKQDLDLRNVFNLYQELNEREDVRELLGDDPRQIMTLIMAAKLQGVGFQLARISYLLATINKKMEAEAQICELPF